MRKNQTAIRALTAIEAELQRLPKNNAFGESNEESRAELLAWLEDLKRKQPITADVKDWLAGKWSPICDITD